MLRQSAGDRQMPSDAYEPCETMQDTLDDKVMPGLEAGLLIACL